MDVLARSRYVGIYGKVKIDMWTGLVGGVVECSLTARKKPAA